MRLSDARFTVRRMMVAILAVGLLAGWIVRWEQLRVQRQTALARQLLAQGGQDSFDTSTTPEEAIAASLRAQETARMWAEGPPDLTVMAFGSILVSGVVGLALAIGKALAHGVLQRRRALQLRQSLWKGSCPLRKSLGCRD